jgi:asparagine synthase (glutamine-hydrolysing)
MRGALKKDIEQTLLQQPIYGAELLNIPFLHSLVNDFFAEKPISAWGIWQIYAWQKWASENGLMNLKG